MERKSIKKNLIYNVILNLSKVMFPLITAPYVARVLEPDGVGLFNFANTYAGYFALFAAMGNPMYGIREIAKIRNDKEGKNRLVSELISVTIFSTFLCSFLFVLSIFLIPQLSENYVLFLLSAFGLYLTPLRIDWFYQGCEDFGYITFRSLIIRVLSIVALFAFVHEKSDLIIYVIINSVGSVANEAWNYVKLYKLGIHPYFTWKGFRHLKPLLILFASTIAIAVYTVLDTIMLGFMADYSEVGYYNSATHISKTMLSISTSLAAVAMPRISYYLKEKQWEEINILVEKSLSIVSFLAFPITSGVAVAAPVFVPLFFGEQFCGAIFPLQIVIFVVVVIGLNNLTGIQIMVGLGLDKLFLYSILTGTIANFILNLFLIPTYGAAGAAFSSVFAETIILFVTAYIVTRKTNVVVSKYRDVFYSILYSVTFLPLFWLLKWYFHGWFLLFVFFLIASSLYIICQYYVKNMAITILVNAVSLWIRNK